MMDSIVLGDAAAEGAWVPCELY